MTAPQDELADRGSGAIAFTLLLWLVAGYIFVSAFGFRYPANLAPLMLGGSAFALLSWLLIGEPLTRRVSRMRGGTTSPIPVDAPPDTLTAGADERAALAWMVGTCGLLVVFGFLAGMTVAMLGLLRLYSHEGWVAAIATSVGVVGVLYLAFGVILGVQFFPGVLGLWA